MYEVPKKDLAWRGMVSKTLDTKAKPDKQRQQANRRHDQHDDDAPWC